MIKRFFNEERAQTTIEYLLMTGGVMIATVVVYGVYTGMTQSAGESLNTTATSASGSMATAIENSIE